MRSSKWFTGQICNLKSWRLKMSQSTLGYTGGGGTFSVKEQVGGPLGKAGWEAKSRDIT